MHFIWCTNGSVTALVSERLGRAQFMFKDEGAHELGKGDGLGVKMECSCKMSLSGRDDVDVTGPVADQFAASKTDDVLC